MDLPSVSHEAMPMHYNEREAEVYDRVYANIREDIPFWQDLACEYAGTTGRALELACGTLRVMLPVAEAGVRVTGIDESPHMLAMARQKLAGAPAEVQARVTLAEGDMRTFELAEKFQLIYVPFNTFGLLLTIEDQLAALERVKAHLAPGGVFALDVFVPDVERLTSTGAYRWLLEVDETFEDGVRVQRDMVRHTDPRKQILKVTWRTKEYQAGKETGEWLTDLEMTYFFPRELEHLMARAGYKIVQYWGKLNRTDFWQVHEPWKQLIVAQPY